MCCLPSAMASINPCKSKGNTCKATSLLKDIRMDTEFTDVVLVCEEEEEIGAHRLILSLSSPYFKKMFTSDFKEAQTGRVDLPDIQRDTMNIILDYIYLKSIDIMAEENIHVTLEVLKWAHLFDLQDLTEHCLEILKKAINMDNWVAIWKSVVLYGESKIPPVFQFIYENLKEIVDNDQLVELSFSEVAQMVMELCKKRIPIEEFFLKGILRYLEDNKINTKESEELCLLINYDYISREYMSDLLKNEKSLFGKGAYKRFYRKQILPKLNYKRALETMHMKRYFANEEMMSWKFVFYNWYYKRLNGCLVNANASLLIADIAKEPKPVIFTQLPFLCVGEFFIPVLVGSSFYIIGASAKNSHENISSQSFLLYECESNSVTVKPSLPEPFKDAPLTCTVRKEIYFVEKSPVETVIQCYNIEKEEWRAMHFCFPMVISCVNLNGSLYLLCMDKRNKHYLYKLVNGKMQFVCNVPLPDAHEDWIENHFRYHVEKAMVVHRNKLFVFMFSNSQCYRMCFTCDPDSLEWSFQSMGFSIDKSQTVWCYSNVDKGIYFYVPEIRKLFLYCDGNVEQQVTFQDFRKIDYDLEILGFRRRCYWLLSDNP